MNMKIVAVSDSHGTRSTLDYIREKYKKADLLIHCGDICLPTDCAKGFITVAGNCDDPNRYPPFELLELEGHRILIVHGHMLFSSMNVNLEAIARFAIRNECDVVFFGHSHIYCDETVNGVRLLNPGSIRSSRDFSGPSYMVVDLTEKHVKAKRMEYKPYQ